MTLPGVAGNLVVAALFTWVAFDGALALVASSMIAAHGIRFWRVGLVPLWRLALRTFTTCFWAFLKPAVVLLGGAVLAWLFPSFASWAGAAWGPRAGATLGLLGAAYFALSSWRGEDARALNRAQVYEMFAKEIPERPTLRQQTILRPYRQAHDEQKRREGEVTGRVSE
jgi:hypothetical protein